MADFRARAHDPKWTRLAAFAIAFAAYALSLRLVGVREHFAFLGDQCLAWDYVGRPFWQLPLYGATTSDGMVTWGPTFYWWIWLVRAVVGPFFGDMPVASGVAMAVFCTAAEAVLIFVLLLRKTSWPAVAAFALLALSSSYINSLTIEPWAPPFALALVNIAIAGFLLCPQPAQPWQAGAITAVLAMATQVHPTGLVIAFCVIVCLVVGALREGSALLATRTILAIFAAVLLLETPYVAARLLQPEMFIRQSEAAHSLRAVLADPSVVDFPAAFKSVFDGLRDMVLGWLPPVAGAAAVVAAALSVVVRGGFWSRRSFVAILPLVCASLGFSLHSVGVSRHWIVVYASCYALVFVFGAFQPLGAGKWRPGRVLAWAGVAGLALAQVWVWNEPRHQYAYYGVMERAARTLAAEGVEIRALQPPEIDQYEKLADSRNFNMLARWAGVRINPLARYYAVVDAGGHIQFKEDPLPGNRQGFPDGVLAH